MPTIIPQIEIEINPVFFVFSWKIHKRKVAAIMSIDSETKELLAIGEKADGEGVTSFSLFEPEQNLPAGMEKMDLLQLFLEFNIAKLLEKQKILAFKPRIVFREDHQLQQIMCGYQRSLLKDAALAAGAREVSFE